MNTNARFTIDGSDRLEALLDRLCSDIADQICDLVPPKHLQAIVLGGGYGRGEGGVLRVANGADEPYNDIEFYVFIHGNRHGNCRRYGSALSKIAELTSATS